MNWIKLSQLRSFGIGEEVFYILLIMLGIFLCYFFLRPITVILMSIQSEILLRYLLSGLGFIILFFIVVLASGEVGEYTYQFFKYTLQGLAIFGIILCVYRLINSVIQKKRRV